MKRAAGAGSDGAISIPSARCGSHRAGGTSVRPLGFTLLEILVTLALIALLTSVLIVGSTRVLNGQPATPQDVLLKAISEARKFAVESNNEVRLNFDAKGKSFIASNDQGTRNFPVVTPGDVNFDFLSSQKGNNAILVGGVLVETQPLSYVTFYPDGTCSPFRAQLRTEGNAQVIAIDPWTCAPILESDKK